MGIMPINRGRKLLFIHIPKTAGTSIVNALDLNEMTSPVEIPAPQHLIGRIVKEKVGEFWDRAFKFTVLRNPETRAVSEFLWRVNRTSIPNIFNEKFTDLENTEESFNKFLLKVSKVKDFNEESFFDHFRPQYQFIEGVKLDKIFKFENLKELEEYFGVILPRINTCKLVPNGLLSERNKAIIKQIYSKDYDTWSNCS